jgi:hypothetical protein
MHSMLSSDRVIDPICLFNGKKLLTNRIKNIASLAVSHAVIYSVLINDKTTHYWRFKFYNMGESYIINIYPVVNLLVIRSPS